MSHIPIPSAVDKSSILLIIATDKTTWIEAVEMGIIAG
jgi:hypothetical protein